MEIIYGYWILYETNSAGSLFQQTKVYNSARNKKNYRVTMREKSNFKDDKLIIVYKKEQLF